MQQFKTENVSLTCGQDDLHVQCCGRGIPAWLSGRKIAFVLSNASTSERTQPTSRKLNVETRLKKVTKVDIQALRLRLECLIYH